MDPSQNTHLENLIEKAIKTGNIQELHFFLEGDTHEKKLMKCSQRFLTKLDKLIIRSLDQNNAKSAGLGFACLYKCGKNLKLPKDQGLPGLISQGLITKWFEKCKQLWIRHGPQWDESLFTLSENFLNALMVVHEDCQQGTYKVTESFLYLIGQVAVDPRIYILIQKEAIRKYNLILDKIPEQLKKNKKILASQDAADIMTKIAGQVLEGGDYDLQSSLMEALCRMATSDQRKKLAYVWFSMGHVANAFAQISDSEFETACRRFLNMVNGMQGDKRRVYSYPCLEVYLGKYELLMPSDEKLEDFWIDFNVGSHSISFYFTLPDEEDGHWETICVNENEVQSYTVTDEDKQKVLEVTLSEVFVIGVVEGSSLTIHFSSSLDILQAAQNVYGRNKNKNTASVKTTSKTTTEENIPQVVPESQLSLGESEKVKASSLKLPSSQMVTPARFRMSESEMCIISSGGGVVNIGSLKSSTKGINKTCAEKISVCNSAVWTGGLSGTPSSTNEADIKQKVSVSHKTSVAEADVMISSRHTKEKSQEPSFVPDTQPRAGRNTCSSWNKLSISEMIVMPTQKIGSLQRPEPHSSVMGKLEQPPSSSEKMSVSDSSHVLQKQLHSELTKRLEQVLKNGNRDPPNKEAVGLHKKVANSRKDSTENISEVIPGSIFCSPKVLHLQGNNEFQEECKVQMSKLEGAIPVKASVKASTKKTVQDSKKINKTKTCMLSKEKKGAEVTVSMMEVISNRYVKHTQSTTATNQERTGQKPMFKMKWMSTSKQEAVTKQKSFNKTTSSEANKKDIFAFSLDLPVHFQADDSSALLSKTGKTQPVGKEKRYVNKHLFSDTDPENTQTDVSWLRESARKPKPQVTKYPPQKLVKPKRTYSPHLDKSLDLLPTSTGNLKAKNKLQKAHDQEKMIKRAEACNIAQAPGRRPKRAAANPTKSYREPDTDDSHSETENPSVSQIYSTGQQGNSKNLSEADLQVKKRKLNFSENSTNSIRKSKRSNQLDVKACGSKVKPGNVFQETSKVNQKRVFPPCKGTKALKDSLAACQISPPFIEKMRSAERSAPILHLTHSTVLTPRGSPLPASPEPPRQDAPSPILLLPKPHSMVSSKEKNKPPASLYSVEDSQNVLSQSFQSPPSHCSLGGRHSAPSSSPEPSAAEHLYSAPRSPLSLPTHPLLTSTLLEIEKQPLPSPVPEGFAGKNYDLDLSKMSSASLVSCCHSSSKSPSRTGKKKECTKARLVASEKTPATKEVHRTPECVSGPSCWQQASVSSSSERDERVEKKKSKIRVQCLPRMKPRKLFQSSIDASTEERSCVRSSHWDADVEDEDMEVADMALNPSNFCQKLSSELKQKFQKRCEMIEIYHKQSLKAVGQHVSSIGMQITKNRMKSLDQVQKVILEEIQNMEQNDNRLKCIEKDLTMHWKKQTTAFHSYLKQETSRSATLRSALLGDSCHSLEFETGAFTSAMCSIRKDLKSAQEKLLNEMVEGEFQSVKKSLHSLFFS